MAPIIGMLLKEIRLLDELKKRKALAMEALKEALADYKELEAEILVSRGIIGELLNSARDDYFCDDDYDQDDMYENLYELCVTERKTRKDVLTVPEAIKKGKSSKLHKLKPRMENTDRTRSKENKASTKWIKIERKRGNKCYIEV
jgi:hypothetical protein